MRTKKRKIPEAVQAQLERKARLTASFAQRQAAGLDKPARERLKPLLNASTQSANVPDLTPATLSNALKRLQDSLLGQPLWTTTPRWMMGTSPFGTISIDVEPVRPSVKPEHLEALKNATPYKPRPRIPDMVEVITGWRGWGLSSNGRLQALGQSHIWPAKQAMVAECALRLGGAHIAPAFSCSCGIWAFKDLDRLVAAIGGGYSTIKVLGMVSLWGRVIETENGYRAQYAYPSELWLLDDSLEELGLIYDIPIRRSEFSRKA